MTDPSSFEKSLSRRRQELCSREHAQRIADRLFDHKRRPVAVIRTGNPLKPFHVTDENPADGVVEVEVRV